MQNLFIIKRVDGVEHVIGRLTRTDDGIFDIEDLLVEPGSRELGIPVLTDKDENNVKLMNWIVSFMPPLGNSRLTEMLIATLGIREFDPWEWLKCYRPGGRNTISFSEKIPLGCVTHCSDFSPSDFAGLDLPLPSPDDDYDDCDDGMIFDDCPPPRYDSFRDYIDCYDDDDEEEEYEEEPVPSIITPGRQCSALPIFPENIPAENPITDVKAFAKKNESRKVENLRTIHNTLCKLANIKTGDFVTQQNLNALADIGRFKAEELKEATFGDLIIRRCYLITEHSNIPDNYSKEYADLFWFLSRDLRAAAIARAGCV